MIATQSAKAIQSPKYTGEKHRDEQKSIFKGHPEGSLLLLFFKNFTDKLVVPQTISCVSFRQEEEESMTFH